MAEGEVKGSFGGEQAEQGEVGGGGEESAVVVVEVSYFYAAY